MIVPCRTKHIGGTRKRGNRNLCTLSHTHWHDSVEKEVSIRNIIPEHLHCVNDLGGTPYLLNKNTLTKMLEPPVMNTWVVTFTNWAPHPETYHCDGRLLQIYSNSHNIPHVYPEKNQMIVDKITVLSMFCSGPREIIDNPNSISFNQNSNRSW